jgi:hypothetical protein
MMESSILLLRFLGLFLEAWCSSSGRLQIRSPESCATGVGEGKEDTCNWHLYVVLISDETSPCVLQGTYHLE